MLLLGSRLHHSGVSKNYCCILKALCHAINHYAIELSGVHILMLNINVGLRNSIVKDAFRYLQFGALLLHCNQQLGYLALRSRPNVVLKNKRRD